MMKGERKPSGKEKAALAKKNRPGNPAESVAPNWDRFPGIFPDDFPTTVARIAEITDLMKQLEEEKRSLAADVEAYIIAAEETAVSVDFEDGGIRLVPTRVTSRTERRIKAEKLLERGVSTEDIDYATTGGTEYTYVQVRKEAL